MLFDGLQQVTVWWPLRALQRVRQADRALAMESSRWPTTRRSSISATRWSRKVMTRGSCDRCRCGRAEGQEPEKPLGCEALALSLKAFSARRSTTQESFCRPRRAGPGARTGRHLAQDEDGLFFKPSRWRDRRRRSVVRVQSSIHVLTCRPHRGRNSFFPPPAAGAEVLADGDGAVQGAADGRHELVVQRVVGHLELLAGRRPRPGPGPAGD